MRYLYSKAYSRSLAGMDEVAQQAAEKAIRTYMAAPDHPGLNVHGIEGARNPRFRSARATKSVRLILHRDDEETIFCYVGEHDTAYRWAQHRTLRQNQYTGAIQELLTEEVVQEVTEAILNEDDAGQAIFAHLEADYLLRLGLPEEWLAAVQSVTEDQFFEHLLDDLLPEEAAEALLHIAISGEAPELPTAPERPADPFRQRDSRRRYRLIEDDEDLRSALEGGLAHWRVFLHPAQQDLVDREFDGPAMISGGAGTGKTVVALHRTARVAREDPQARVLLTTFSRTLAAQLRNQLEQLLGPDTDALSRVEVANLHAVAASRLARAGESPYSLATPDRRTPLFREAFEELRLDEAEANLALAEWEAAVNEEGIETEAAYLGLDRTGRGRALAPARRQKLWPVLKAMSASLRAAGLLTAEQTCRDAARHIESRDASGFTHVIADEVQDFGPAELRLLSSLAGPDQRLVLTGDVGQRIYKGRTSFLAAGIDLRGRSHRLSVNYRTSEQIRRFADGLQLRRIPDLDTPDGEPRTSVSLFTGPHPETVRAATVADEVERVTAWIQAHLSRGTKAAEIVILARSKSALDRVREVAGRLRLTTHLLSPEDPPPERHLSIGTMHNSKGLEFRIVVIMGTEDRYLPNRTALEHFQDEAARSAFIERERNLLYVACTRAREHLLVSCSGEASRFLGG